ncbi:hypothetical protein HK098_006779 [Nowakowskiella sp. JEL0407]|nr:hypothetical protein HK098_006779 [Nowakowskiella sp. JEL0407]
MPLTGNSDPSTSSYMGNSNYEYPKTQSYAYGSRQLHNSNGKDFAGENRLLPPVSLIDQEQMNNNRMNYESLSSVSRGADYELPDGALVLYDPEPPGKSPDEYYWIPAMIVPPVEFDYVTIGRPLKPFQRLIRIFKDNSDKIVYDSSLMPFDPLSPQFKAFQHKFPEFLTDQGVRHAIVYHSSGSIHEGFKWKKWGISGFYKYSDKSIAEAVKKSMIRSVETSLGPSNDYFGGNGSQYGPAGIHNGTGLNLSQSQGYQSHSHHSAAQYLEEPNLQSHMNTMQHSQFSNNRSLSHYSQQSQPVVSNLVQQNQNGLRDFYDSKRGSYQQSPGLPQQPSGYSYAQNYPNNLPRQQARYSSVVENQNNLHLSTAPRHPSPSRVKEDGHHYSTLSHVARTKEDLSSNYMGTATTHGRPDHLNLSMAMENYRSDAGKSFSQQKAISSATSTQYGSVQSLSINTSQITFASQSQSSSQYSRPPYDYSRMNPDSKFQLDRSQDGIISQYQSNQQQIPPHTSSSIFNGPTNSANSPNARTPYNSNSASSFNSPVYKTHTNLSQDPSSSFIPKTEKISDQANDADAARSDSIDNLNQANHQDHYDRPENNFSSPVAAESTPELPETKTSSKNTTPSKSTTIEPVDGEDDQNDSSEGHIEKEFILRSTRKRTSSQPKTTANRRKLETSTTAEVENESRRLRRSVKQEPTRVTPRPPPKKRQRKTTTSPIAQERKPSPLTISDDISRAVTAEAEGTTSETGPLKVPRNLNFEPSPLFDYENGALVSNDSRKELMDRLAEQTRRLQMQYMGMSLLRKSITKDPTKKDKHMKKMRESINGTKRLMDSFKKSTPGDLNL